ncbi:unnamed protein product [Paramecium octaurelia]|uniref:PSI domain-containing protein n=1 Tax=Paramecium octaurelia TaxID=43137 RepID=A0A8S1XMW0_PAROT|nr:unnamed protein product [Paramecium octaurelia]
MNIKVLVLTLLVVIVASQQYSISQCDCSQLLSEDDCSKNDINKCQWDSTKKTCKNQDTTTNPVIDYAKYCDNFKEIECPKQKPCSNCGSYSACAWVEGQCTFFTDCTAFNKTTDSDCQAISNKCITDGTHCVEIDTCDKYKKQQSCVKNVFGSLCYWDTKNNSCVDADTCDKLPIKFQTDKECRDQIQSCTAKSGGGCIDSGNNCSDQNLEIQCVWDKSMKIECYWNGTQCKDRICDNAPSTLNTDDTCKLFKTDGSCTTKLNGGCITRTTCSAATIQAACIKNNTNEDCYWSGTACVDKICSNAPTTLTTNSACAAFSKGCITKQGGGCVQNGDCSAANISTACVKNMNNFDCIWDSTCKEKTCVNAPKSNTTHDQCTSYLSTCTVQSGGGCQTRKCDNAPTTLNTNDACETYLPANKCITKNGGGCTINTTCSLISIEVACIKNSLGQPCFWHAASGSCKDKICVNAPSSNNSHELCQQFLNTCTVNSTNTGCVEKTCENSLTLSICDKDLNSNICIWKARCYKRQCAMASSSIASHSECQTYYSSCTLSNTGKGCVTLPIKCEAITIEAACKIKANKQSCGWTGSQCIDKACNTAPKTIQTTLDCQTYLSSCVANNPITVNGTSTIQGCQDLPKTCDARKSSENCNITKTAFPTCFWDSSSIKCVEKSCTTANLSGTPGALSAGYLSTCITTNAQGTCTQTSYPCISNNTKDGCMVKPTSCSQLVQQNCKDGSKSNGDCYWNGSNCVEKTCTNIISTTHNDCYNIFNQCTVNDNGTACLQLASACTSYKIQENCKITSTQKNCYWTGTVCRNAICDDTPDSDLFDSDEECLKYQTQNGTCTIIAKVGGQGCVQKQPVCSNYKTSSQCHKTLSNVNAQDDCKWINGICYSLSTFATGACSTFKGTQEMCKAYRQGCTNVANASTSTACTLDCTLRIGSGLTFQDCQNVDPTCSVKKDGSGCIVIQSTCTGYGTTDINCYKSGATGTQSNCLMNKATPPSCQAVSSASDCALLSGSGLDHAKCQAYNIACTSLGNGSGCQEFKAICTAYTGNTDNCTDSQQGKCYLNGSDCVRFTNCFSITGTNLTHQICNSYNTDCTVNKQKTACQDRRATCDLYTSQEQCTVSAADLKASQCVWSGTACLAVTVVATHCAYITGTDLTNSFCASYNNNCTVNYEKTACQEKKAQCGLYSTKSSCTLSQAADSAGKCIWNNGGCRYMTSLDTIAGAIVDYQMSSARCAQFNPVFAAIKDGSKCFIKKGQCTLYTEEDYCTTSSASGAAANCIWDGSHCQAFTSGSLCKYVQASYVQESYCPSVNPLCTTKMMRNGCYGKKANCSDYDVEDDCQQSLASGTAGFCVWTGSICTYVTDPSIHCAKVTTYFLTTDEYCASYHASCIPTMDGTGCQQIQSNCASYTDSKTCYKSLNDGYCAWIDKKCIFLTSPDQCASVSGNSLTSTYCNGLRKECWVTSGKQSCYQMKSTCEEYSTNDSSQCVRTLTSGSAGLCGWNSKACFQVITASQCNTLNVGFSSSGITDAFCATYNAGCIADASKNGCQELLTSCSSYTEFYKCSYAGTLQSKVRCYFLGQKCIQITDPASQCQKIQGTFSEAGCSSYHSGCTIKRDGSACQERKAVCANYTTEETCFYSSAPSPYNICIFINNNCVAARDLLTDCTAITASSGLTDQACTGYNSTCTTNKAGTSCQDKKGLCSEYQNQDSCTVSSSSKCIWRTSCISVSDATTECVYVVGTNLTHNICVSYNEGCTVNKAGTSCQQMKNTCADYTKFENCTMSQDSGPQSNCVWHSTCVYVSDITTDCAYVTGTNLTDYICSFYNPGCVANYSGTACQEKKFNCQDYTLKENCSANCVWDDTLKCIFISDPSAQCSLVNGKTGLNLEMCQLYNSECINLKDGTGCQHAQADCKNYTTQNQCVPLAKGTSCLWYDNSCNELTGTTCSAITGTDLNHDICYSYNKNCTSLSDGTSCQDYKSTCEQYSGTTESCTQSYNAKCYLYNSNTCITILNVSTDCAKITGVSLTYEICQSYNLGCSVNRAKTACVQKAAQCSGYSTAMSSCYQAAEGFCIASTSSDSACVPASSASNCETVFLGTGNYSHNNCSTIKAGCTVNGSTACMARTCANATGFAFNHDNCFAWLKTCTVNQANNGCTIMAAKCSDQQSTSCLNAIEGVCLVKGCDTAPSDASHDDDTECSNYSQVCTVARAGGCQVRTACSLYKSSLQCKLDMNDKKCFWNPSVKTCVDLACANIEISNLYNTHDKCYAVDSNLGCTVRALNKEATPGCMARGPCSSYTIKDQCRTNASGIDCVWNTNSNLPEPACQDKSCTTAPTSTLTHNDCLNYYTTSSIKCTVYAKAGDNGAQPILGGCQQTAECSTYIDIEQCKINSKGEPCGWNGKECNDKSCSTAPATSEYDDDTKCKAYLNNKCTVSSEGQGCIDIPEICELMNQNQCYYNRAGQPCYWTGTDCITRACENAPEETATAEQCNNYLYGCTIDVIKCKIKICEDYLLTTDEQCTYALSTCTTNGTNCVTRGTCVQSQNKAGCVVSSSGQSCEWIPDVVDSQNVVTTAAYCTIKTCNTAPISLVTDVDCAKYFTNCTTKSGGGCVTKSTCSAASVNAACISALNGTICAWDNTLNKCRDKDCQDLIGTTHTICQTQRQGCTAGPNGRCARVQSCELTTLRQACIEGTNGPCLWIEKFVNSDGSKGACFTYTSCKSLAWNTDESCKLISNQCTTNGTNCIGITLCSETNIDGGCVTGYDGSCIQSVPALNSADPKICKPFKSCADAFYATHQDCQIANKKCTTDGSTGCIDLGACSTYKSQPGCQINDKGSVVQSGVITSTGVCTWDATTSTCRDQICSDLNGISHAICNSQLSTCTSDSIKCLLKANCSTYSTQIICQTAVGNDGLCFWELGSATNNNTPKCRLLTCADIQNGTSISVCQAALPSCISNGTACIPKGKCSTYTTKTACNSGGLDGLCVFTQSTSAQAIVDSGTCTLMNSCSSANNDQTACVAAQDRCSWTPATSTVTSKCISHTCGTYNALIGTCSRFFNWDKQSQQICSMVDGICAATDPQTLKQSDCFKLSGYTYTWNSQTNKCQVCTKQDQPNSSINNTINDTNNNNTNTAKGLLLTFILGYLLI